MGDPEYFVVVVCEVLLLLWLFVCAKYLSPVFWVRCHGITDFCVAWCIVPPLMLVVLGIILGGPAKVIDKGLFLFAGPAAITLCVAALVMKRVFASPYTFPYCRNEIDISGRRNPNVWDEVDQYIIDNGISWVGSSYALVCNTFGKMETQASSSWLSRLRLQQLRDISPRRSLLYLYAY